MTKIVTRTVKASALPAELVAGLDVQPDELIRITLDARDEHDRNVAALLELVDRIGAEAERRGLTDEKLAELLNEDEDQDRR
jgi:hypothetical protein